MLAVVAPSNLSISYTVYMVPLRDRCKRIRWEEVYAYDVFALVKCVNPECISARACRLSLQTYLRSEICTCRLVVARSVSCRRKISTNTVKRIDASQHEHCTGVLKSDCGIVMMSLTLQRVTENLCIMFQTCSMLHSSELVITYCTLACTSTK